MASFIPTLTGPDLTGVSLVTRLFGGQAASSSSSSQPPSGCRVYISVESHLDHDKSRVVNCFKAV